MKNKIAIIIISFFFNAFLFAENINIQSKTIIVDKKKETSIFNDEVIVKTVNGTQISSDYAEYNKKTGFLVLKENIIAIDIDNNILKTNYAEFNEKEKILKSIGPTNIITTEKYEIVGENIILNDKTKILKSNYKSVVTDGEGNKIYLDNFEYQANNNIFKSVGFIKINDLNNNSYEFSQIYIDTKKKEILGTDIKSFLNDKNFKIKKDNKPRIFANTLQIKENNTIFKKSIFTLCDYRGNEKCPPWTIQASEMLHDKKKKTIYYDNALIKVYNIPIFFIPKLAHPDPTVSRRSGFLPPSFSDTKNLGASISAPYFWAINDDKNFTLTNRLFVDEHPLFLGEYEQAFKNSNVYSDFSYTRGYKNTSLKKAPGDKSHFFSKFVKNFKGKNNSENTFSLVVQNVSNDKYLKLYKIDSNLVDYNTSVLENSINFAHENDDIFFGANTSVYETLNPNYTDKYEYILPEVTFDKNLFSNEKFGNLDLQSNYKIRNYDTNKYNNFLINDLKWDIKENNFKSGLQGRVLGHLRNINYETRNEELYKKDNTSEIFGALGYFSQLNLQKKINNTIYKLKPKLLLRYAPGSMRQESSANRLNPDIAFNIDRLNNLQNFESGLSSTYGFDYKVKRNNSNFNFSVAQILNEKENKKMASKSSLDEKLSDIVGASKFQINNKVDLNYNFSIDQNYNDINYNEIGTTLNLNPIKIDFNYLEENKHIGDQKYISSKVNYSKNENGLFSFETKRNLITNSAEFYNLSYEYMNDCLRAGLVYRREFYKDSEIEPEDSLMFKITLIPFGKINSPSFNK
jgi:LPS-assembly protein